MRSEVRWQRNFIFDATSRNLSVTMDASGAAGGNDQGQTPKELVLAAICGCTGMDFIGLLKKSKVQPESFSIGAEAETVQSHPRVFKQVSLSFQVTGSLTKEQVVDAVHKSQTIFCGVSAMIAKSCPITYEIHLNGELISTGRAQFAS